MSVLALFMIMAAGCAATDRYVNVLYRPSVYAGGGAGNLFLTATGMHAEPGKAAGTKWIIGKVKNNDGSQTGDVVTTVAPVDLILDAFNRELTSAGYKIIRVNALPDDVTKGISVDRAEIKIENVSSIMKDEGTVRLTISLDLWKNKKKLKKIHYESGYSDAAFKGRDLRLQDITQKALQGLMEKAIPEIIKELGK